MLDKDKIILIIYFGISKFSDNIIFNMAELMKDSFDESVKTIIIPDKFSSKTRVECINPKLCDENQWEKIEEIIEKANKIINNGRN